MSVIDVFNSPDRPAGRVLDWITHHCGWFLTAYAALCVTTWFIDTAWLAVLALTVTVPFCLAFLITKLHTTYTRLCVHCMSEVPDDAAAQAQHRRWLLKAWHLEAKPVFVCGVFAATAAGPLLVPVSWDTGAGSLPIEAWAITIGIAERLHHRLRPWCPYCPRWDGDGGIPEPSPDPTDRNVLTG
ncbi:hypothetical protein ACIP5Y_35120 [Nocardia sp. NPDC088792]|uniref:hypothetical protein n=1 Tax=Nocardia sp. NPDC088792 TaxID=3364332 RepID=UPI0037FD5067